MKFIIKQCCFSLLFIVTLTNAFSQQFLINENPNNGDSLIYDEILRRTEVISTSSINVNHQSAISDSVYSIKIGQKAYLITKEYIHKRGKNIFSFYGTGTNISVLFTYLSGDIQGTIFAEGNTYAIETHANKYYLVQLNHAVMRDGCENVNAVSNSQKNNKDNNTLYDETRNSNSVINVLVMYTPSAKHSVSNIYNTAFLAEEESNISLSNSNINSKIKIVYIGETDYTESDSRTDVIRFKADNDGYMDEVHSLREKYSADICVLLVYDYNYPCGDSYTINADRDNAFCIVKTIDCVTGYYSFIHEIGHLIGCLHDPVNTPTMLPYGFGHGYVSHNQQWRTIMAYGGCPRIQYWSNPNLIHEGECMGIINLCDNVKVWALRHSPVSAFFNINDSALITPNSVPNNLDYGFFETSIHTKTYGNVVLRNGQELIIKAGNSIVFSDGFVAECGSELIAEITSVSNMSYATMSNVDISNDIQLKKIEPAEIGNKSIIYPNPTVERLQIQYLSIDRPKHTFITDALGRIVWHGNNPKEIDISSLPCGIYFLYMVYNQQQDYYKIIKK